MTTLVERLQRHSRELNQLIRTYPSPIARCDDQLPKFIALRDETAALLRSTEPTADWITRATLLLEKIETL